MTQRDHSNPLVLGSISPSCLSSRAGHAQRPRKGLEQGFDLVVVGAAVHGGYVHVGPCAAREAFKEILYQLTLQIAHQRASSPWS